MFESILFWKKKSMFWVDPVKNPNPVKNGPLIFPYIPGIPRIRWNLTLTSSCYNWTTQIQGCGIPIIIGFFTCASVALHFPSSFLSLSPRPLSLSLSLSELWWSSSTASILSLNLLVEGQLTMPFLFFIFLCSSTGMLLLPFVFYHSIKHVQIWGSHFDF